MLWKDRDIGEHGNCTGVLCGGGRIIFDDKEMVSGVATLDYTVSLYI